MSEAEMMPIQATQTQPAVVSARQLAEDTDQDLLLETAWRARETELVLVDKNKMMRAAMEQSEKYLAAQQAIQECEAEFAESVKDLNNRIDSLRELQVACLERAQGLKIESKVTTAGTYKVVQKTVRAVIPEKFREIYGEEYFNQLAEVKIKVTEADKLVGGKGVDDGCVTRTPQGPPKIEFVLSKTKSGILTGKKGEKA